jgi:hypothetical protein
LAVTAKFQADFKSFYDAVEKAEVELRGLETGAAKVEKSLNKMADSFSGRKLIQDANLAAKAIEDIGGASMLTAKEQAKVNAQVTEALAKYKALGIEAPASLQKLARDTAGVTTETAKASTGISGMVGSLGKMAGALGIAFSAGAVISFGKQVFAAAGQIEDLSKKMGVSREAVQRWKFAAEQSGATIENVDKAVLAMNKSLGSLDSKEIEKTNDALGRIGLSFSDLRQMNPEDAFNAITKAIGEVEDPMVRAKVATELFSKAGAELLPALADNFAKVAEGASVMSDETIKRLDEAEDAWNALYTKATVVTGELIAFLMKEFSKENPIDTFFKDAQASVSQSLKFMRLDVKAAADDFRDLLRLKDAVFGKQNETPTAPAAPKLWTSSGAPQIGMTLAEADAVVKSLKLATGGTNEYAAALKRLREVIPPLTAEQRKSVEGWLAQGKATKDMATVLRVNEQAVTDFKKEQEDLRRILDKGIGSVLGLADSYKQLGAQMQRVDGIVSTLMVSMPKVNDYLGDLSRVGTQMPMPEPPDIAEHWSTALKEQAKQIGFSFGHDVSEALAYGIETGDWTTAKDALQDAVSQLMSEGIALAIDFVLPGVGQMLKPFIKGFTDKFVSMFRDEAHEATNDIRDDFLLLFGPGGTGPTSGFGILATQLEAIEGGAPAFKALLDAKTPEAFAVAMARVNAILASTPEAMAAAAGFQTKAQLQEMAADAVKIHAYMRDSGLFTAAAVQEAWERANAALVKAGDEAATAAGKAEDALAGLKAELKGLEDSVANEAWEEEMGVIEREQRARIDAIKAEMEAREAQIQEETAAREDAAQQAADDLQRILSERDFVARLRFEYELPEGLTVGAGGNVPGFAGGTRGQYLDFGAGTLAMLHGKERVVTEAEGRATAVGNRPIHVTVMTPDYRVLGEGIAREYQQ